MRTQKRSLSQRGARNPKPERVHDPLFESDAFFDPVDLVQVKYEMLRRAQVDGVSVSQAATQFGFSRPAFYEARRRFESAGLLGLLSHRPGPHGGHKLSEEVVDFLEAQLAKQPELEIEKLVSVIEMHFGLQVHPRSVERALARRRKKNSAGSRA
jgi:transposase